MRKNIIAALLVLITFIVPFNAQMAPDSVIQVDFYLVAGSIAAAENADTDVQAEEMICLENRRSYRKRLVGGVMKWRLASPTRYYSSAGEFDFTTKEFIEIIALPGVASGNGYAINISSAGFTNIRSIDITAIKNTAIAVQSPQISIKSYTTSSVVVNITQGNASLVSVLGLNVLSGASADFVPAPTGVSLSVKIKGD